MKKFSEEFFLHFALANKTAPKKNMPYVYILECKDGSYYTGAASNLEKRLCEHQNGKAAKYTRGRRPVKLLYSEYYPELGAAYRREKEIQNLTKSEKSALVGGGGLP